MLAGLDGPLTLQRVVKMWLGCFATVGPGERHRLQQPDILQGVAGLKHAKHCNSRPCSM